MVKAKTISDVKEMFKEKGLILITEKYQNNQTKLEYYCKCGNIKTITLGYFKRGIGICKDCGTYKDNPSKYSFDEVRKIFEDNGCELLSSEYINNKSKLDFKCKCGRLSTKVLSEFLERSNCAKCSHEERAALVKYSYEEVVTFFEEKECDLVSTEYKNNLSKLNYVCHCGNESSTTLNNFLRRGDCRKCWEKSRIKYTSEYVKSIIEEEGCKYISQEKENSNTKVTFICTCNREGTVLLDSFKIGARCSHCAKESYRRNNSGKNHMNWNPELTEEERTATRNYLEYYQWRREVFERDNYSCQCCGSRKDLVAHHLNSYHWCKDRRVDVTNGVSLCTFHHRKFHSIYGYKHNTENQFKDFIINYKIERSA